MVEVVVFPCTYKCNAKCIMCTIHERNSEDLPIECFEKFFSHEKLANLKTINISGGEPTLRNDLKDLILMISSKCRNLTEIIISTNGLVPELLTRQIENILQVIDSSIRVLVNVSLDSLNSKSDIIRGVKNASDRAIESLDNLKELRSKYQNLKIGISCIIVATNLDCLEDIYEYSQSNGLLVDFVYATENSAYINSESKYEDFKIDEDQKKEIITTLRKFKNYSSIESSKLYYEKLIDQLEGKKVIKDCIFKDKKGVLLEADGVVRVCGMADESFLGNIKEDNLDEILSMDIPKELYQYCQKCETNSYHNWSEEAQISIKKDMLSNIAKKLREKRLCDN